MPQSAKGTVSLSAVVRATPKAKKIKQLRQREAERRARTQAEVEGWFEQFDTNKDGKLQRDELRELLTWLHPSRPPSEANLDYLIERATAVESHTIRLKGDKDGDVLWHDARQTVLWYSDYCKDQNYIDSVFRRFDDDNSGELDSGELLQLLQGVAPEGCVVDEADVSYVLEHFDGNSNGLIDRDELLPMLAKWAHVAFTKLEQQNHDEQQRRHSIAGQWQNLKTAVAPEGGAVDTVGHRLKMIATLAKQQRGTQARSRWQSAGDRTGAGGSPTEGGGGKSIMRLVAAAKQQKQLEDEAQRLLNAGGHDRTDVESGAEGGAEGGAGGARRLSKWKGAGKSVHFPSTPATATPVTSEPSPDTPMRASEANAKAPSPAAGWTDRNNLPPAAAPTPAAAVRRPSELKHVHSRGDVLAKADRDGPWKPADTKIAKQLAKKPVGESTKATSDTPEEGASRGSKGTSVCAIL